jgi:hypothetical protein
MKCPRCQADNRETRPFVFTASKFFTKIRFLSLEGPCG